MISDSQIAEVVYITIAIVVATVSNILYRARHRLVVKPLYLRLMYGALGVSIYVTLYILVTRKNPNYSTLSIIMIYLIGYYTEMITDQMEL